ncbi:uncharacterized protein LOC134223011 [Armigeres subalbatus]|uniref:uncharacterized protein LOC134223011 n=1 Tax=Armigeres subalbatus TaxID=124917 RepID=UPI002ED56CD3
MDNHDKTISNCKRCNQSDTVDARMVACDQCQLWEHFTCAGVDDTVKDLPYLCKACAAQVSADNSKNTNKLRADNRSAKSGGRSVSKKSSKLPSVTVSQTASARAAALKAQMKLIEEEKQIKGQELKEQEELQNLELEEERRMIVEKKQLLEEERKLRQRRLEEQRALLKKQQFIRRESMEKKNEVIKQVSERGSETSSVPDSGDKLKDWLEDHHTDGRSMEKTTGEQETHKGLRPMVSIDPLALQRMTSYRNILAATRTSVREPQRQTI